MIDTMVIIAILAFIGMVLLVQGVYYSYNYVKERRRILDKIKGKEAPSPLTEQPDIFSQDEDEGIKEQFMKVISKIGDQLKPRSETDILSMRKNLIRGGYRRQNAHLFFFGIKAFFAALFPLFLFMGKVLIVQSLSSSMFMALSIGSALAGFYLPNLWLKLRIAYRQEKILESFPDALDLMVVCVEAGMGLDAAISRVGEEMKLRSKILSEEFRLLSLELRAGKLRRDALRNFAMRTGLDDVNSLITLLIQTDKFGTSVAQALRVHSDSMRTKRYQRAEEIAAKLPVKLVFPLILFIFPSLFVVIIGPAMIRIYRLLFPVLGGQ